MLCQRSVELRRSHLLPAALYKRALDRSSKNPHPVLFSAEGEHKTSMQATRSLLCCDCEQLFHRRGEDWTLRHAASTPSTFPLRDILLSCKAHQLTHDVQYFRTDAIPSVDADALGYFALSVIWRAAVSDWEIDGELIPQLQLGPYAEAIRTYLLSEADVPGDLALEVIVCSADETHLMTTMPETKHWGAYHSHFFDIPGISFMVDVGARIPDEFRQMCLFRGAGRPLFYTATAQIANARDYARLREYRDRKKPH
jgi:hypothetical protein